MKIGNIFLEINLLLLDSNIGPMNHKVVVLSTDPARKHRFENLNMISKIFLPYCVPLTLCQFSEETLHPLPEFQIHDSHKFKMFFVKKKEKKICKKEFK